MNPYQSYQLFQAGHHRSAASQPLVPCDQQTKPPDGVTHLRYLVVKGVTMRPKQPPQKVLRACQQLVRGGRRPQTKATGTTPLPRSERRLGR
jgi:hypothetical protein